MPKKSAAARRRAREEKPKRKVNRGVDGQMSGGRKVRNTFVDPVKQ